MGYMGRHGRGKEERKVTFIIEIGGFGIKKMVDLTPHH
jgi:hypothetical protein